MEKRKWTSQQKLQIVLEGLSGQIEIRGRFVDEYRTTLLAKTSSFEAILPLST